LVVRFSVHRYGGVQDRMLNSEGLT
jgi:hypothetical protein